MAKIHIKNALSSKNTIDEMKAWNMSDKVNKIFEFKAYFWFWGIGKIPIISQNFRKILNRSIFVQNNRLMSSFSNPFNGNSRFEMTPLIQRIVKKNINTLSTFMRRGNLTINCFLVVYNFWYSFSSVNVFLSAIVWTVVCLNPTKSMTVNF